MLEIGYYVFCAAWGAFSGIVTRTLLDAVLLGVIGSLTVGFILFNLIK
jgi:hypothetical protein